MQVHPLLQMPVLEALIALQRELRAGTSQARRDRAIEPTLRGRAFKNQSFEGSGLRD